ncbi:hypothetical protein [Kitasatospora sp. NPDC101183]|uniref:hypothetical protein n=1 Tax=Kitasatospora sp. NPDC101183 TaxID=3364100 RepID=UPI00380AC4B9
MSYPPDPNNPYGPPQPQPQGYGYPQQQPQPQPAAYGYPQQPQQAAYGYPQAAGYGYPPVAQPQSMPGLVMTTRVLLFVIGGVQVLIMGALFIGAAGAKSVANQHSSSSTTTAFGNMAAGILLVFAVLYLLAAILSITLGVKFGSGGPATRVTTIVYASIFLLIGAFVMISGIAGSSQTPGSAGFGIVFGGLWCGICILWIVAMSTRDGVAWFNRPRY